MIGFITLYTGSMKSGKTSKLFEVLDKAKYRKGIKSCLVRPIIDDREFIGRQYKSGEGYQVFTCRFLLEIKEVLKEYDIICIDEGQFLLDLGPMSNELALMGKEVYIAALNGDSEMKPWDSVSNLLPFVDYIEKFSGVCEECGKARRITFSFFTKKKTDQTIIGDGEYKIYCRECYKKLSDIKNDSSSK